jgi:hypothetical protein
MQSRLATTGVTVKRLAVVFVLLWWAGLSCLAGCALEYLPDEQGQHCQATSEGGDCCAAEDGQPDAGAALKQGAAAARACCLSPSDEAGLPEPSFAGGGQALSNAPGIALPALRFERPDRASALPPQPPPHRQRVHLRCCVLLI